MQTRRTYVVLIALSAVLALDGCAWTKRTWNRVWGRDSEDAQHEAKRQAEQEPTIVTGAEGDIPAPAGTSAPAVASESVPGMPETQAPATAPAPAVTPSADLPSATSTPAAPEAMPQASATTDAAGSIGGAAQQVTLQADSTFAFGKSTLTPAGKKKLDELAARIAGMDKAALASVTVTGHADRIGSPDRNQALSEQRAEAVRDYLAGHGINEAIIKTEGRGASEPVAECPGNKVTKKLIDCLAPNRRVEVVIQSR